MVSRLCGTLLATFLAQDAPPQASSEGFEAAIPADALLFVGVDDVRQVEASWKSSPWGRYFRGEEATPLREWFEGLVREVRDFARDRTGTDPLDLLASLEGPAALALLGASLPEIVEHGDHFPLALGMLCRIGGSGEEFLVQFDRLFDSRLESGELVRRIEDVAGVEAAIVRPAEALPSESSFVMTYGVQADTFVVTGEPRETVAGIGTDVGVLRIFD